MEFIYNTLNYFRKIEDQTFNKIQNKINID
jgi:hypothetical protein